jgi:hypothetical protein
MVFLLTDLGESLEEVVHNLWIRTFEFLDDVKTLVQLCKDINNGRGEKGMLRTLLELQCK